MEYSEVAIKCEEKAYKILKKICGEIDFMPDKIYKDENEYIFYWDWVKWSTNYKEISEIEKVLDKFDDLQEPYPNENTGYGYKFLRIGEIDDDIETRENDWEIKLSIIRKIDIPDNLQEITI